MQCSAASSRSSSKPNAIHASAVRAIGERSSRSSRTSIVICARSRGHSIAVPETSPWPWAAWPSPTERSAPSTGIGRKSDVPATSSLQSMLPPHLRGGIVEWMPASGGGMPITPRNGATVTRVPRSSIASPSRIDQPNGVPCRTSRPSRGAPPRRSARRASGPRARLAPRSGPLRA